MTDLEFPTIPLITPMSIDHDVRSGQMCMARVRMTYKSRIDRVAFVFGFEAQNITTSDGSWDLGNRDERGCILLPQPCVVQSAEDVVVTCVYQGEQPKTHGSAVGVLIGIVAFPDEYAERVLLDPLTRQRRGHGAAWG